MQWHDEDVPPPLRRAIHDPDLAITPLPAEPPRVIPSCGVCTGELPLLQLQRLQRLYSARHHTCIPLQEQEERLVIVMILVR